LKDKNYIEFDLTSILRYSKKPDRNGCPGISANIDVNLQPVSDAVVISIPPSITSGSPNVAIHSTSIVSGTSFLWSTPTSQKIEKVYFDK